jgi:hypothetical protein
VGWEGGREEQEIALRIPPNLLLLTVPVGFLAGISACSTVDVYVR